MSSGRIWWERQAPLGAVDHLILAVAAGHWPLGVMARNYWQLVHPERIVALALGVALLASLVAYLLTRAGVRRATAVFTVFVATIMMMRGGQLVWQFGDAFGWLMVIVPVALAAVVAARLGDHPAVRATSIGLAVALGSGPLISLSFSLQEAGPDTIVDLPASHVVLEERPNVFFVVVDGYPGSQALEQEFELTGPGLVSELEERGFEVPQSAWSPYWSTELAVSSILQMDYPVEEGPLNPTTSRGLHRVIGGDNRLVEILHENGYHTIMVESGWVGSSCGPGFDRCVPSPWLDDLAFLTLWEGVWGKQVLMSKGHAYTVGTRATMDWLKEQAAEISLSGQPTFVFAHLIAPHEPFFLDGSCETVVTSERIGDRFYRRDVDHAVRESFFFEQMDCVDSFMLELADLVGPSDVVVFVSDHGTDRRLLLDVPGEQWALEAVIERMNVLVAVRPGPGCRVGDSLVTTNLMRRVLSCYATTPLEDVPSRVFLPSMFQLAPEEVDSLLRSTSGG